MLDFDGQVVVVTGSGSPKGIGRVIARTFARQGAVLIIADMNKEGLDETVKIIRAEGGKAEGIVLDVTSKDSVDAMVQHILDTYGRLDVLVNNAGISQKVTVEDMTLADMERIFRVNMFGLFLTTQACMKPMKAAGYDAYVDWSRVLIDVAGLFDKTGDYNLKKKFKIYALNKMALMETEAYYKGMDKASQKIRMEYIKFLIMGLLQRQQPYYKLVEQL